MGIGLWELAVLAVAGLVVLVAAGAAGIYWFGRVTGERDALRREREREKISPK